MEMRLIDLRLKNFKGQQEFSLIANSHNINVLGDNATGKTTLNDAWKWLLFDKDSANRSDFSIKTIDKTTGEEIHFLEHEVEATLGIDGIQKKLKKMMKENWVKKKGSVNPEYDGNVYSYWIDDIPVKKGEYVAEISKLMDEKVFRLITDPFYANDVMKWTELRDVLVTIAGDVTDQQVIDKNEKLKRLPEILEGRSIDAHKKMIAEQIKKYNEEKKGIPPRIDELTNSLSDGLNVDYTAIEIELKDLNILLNDTERKLSQGSDIMKDKLKLQQDLFTAQDKIRNRRTQIEQEANSGVKGLSDEKATLQNEQYKLNTDNSSLKQRILGISNTIQANDKLLDDLRKRFAEVDAEIFPDPEIDSVCPTCGQAIPEGQIHEKYTDMRTKFQQMKNKSLDDIQSDGLAAKGRNEQLKEELKKLQDTLESNTKKLVDIGTKIAELVKQLSTTTVSLDYGRDPEYVHLENEIYTLQKEIDKPAEDTTKEILDAKNDLVIQIDSLKKTLNNKDNNDKAKRRIEELKAEEKDLALKIAALEGDQFLIESFIKAKAALLESNINKCFKYVTFKLFDLQQNGGVNPCCVTLIQGIPWNDANHEGKTNGGLDIINTLTKFYGVNAPIFIDGRESTNKIIATDSQVINLIVTHDKSLKVEVEA